MSAPQHHGHLTTGIMAQLFAGTSGWAYPSWKPDFYPQKLAQAKFLSHYATGHGGLPAALSGYD